MRSSLAGLARQGLRAGVVFYLTVLMAACGPANSVDVKYNGFTIVPNRTSAATGNITFNLTNTDGQVLHELAVVQTDLPADKLPLGATSQVDETGLKIVSRSTKLDVGQTGTLTANLAPGHYVLMCNIVGHYQLGMHADFTVTP